jgi:hypothetical protein
MRRSLVELLLVCCSGCDVDGTVGLAFDPSQWMLERAQLAFAPHHDLDVLFVVDNSGNMAPKQAALVTALDTFIHQLNGARHHHFGVITSDLGAGASATGQCVAPGGDGVLVAMGRAAPADCMGPTGARYIDWGGGNSNLPAGQSLPQTLGCLLQVGDRGCDFPQPLEAARRALTNPVNMGFLRDDSLLVLVLVSDGDDCSAPPDSPVFDPTRTDLGPFDRRRCVAAGVECGNPPQPPLSGTLDGCLPRAGAGLYDLDRYRDFFLHSTGIKRNPNDVLLALLAGPPTPFAMADEGGVPTLQPSCAGDDPGFTALPAVRLQALAQGSPRSVITNVCAPGAGGFILGSVALNLTAADPGAACLPAPIADAAHPDCDVQANAVPMRDCGTTSGALPCWQLLDEPSCLPFYNPRDRAYEQIALTLHPAPFPGSQVSAQCVVLDRK